MKKVKKMALGGIGAAVGSPANQAKQQAMAAGAANQAKQQAMGMNKLAGAGAALTQNIGALGKVAGGQQGLGSAMSGPKTGLGTAMGMNKLAGAGAALGKKLGMKSGGAVGSASKRADGIAAKGKTKGRMC